MGHRPGIVWSPRNVALVYSTVGALWIVFSDSLTTALVDDSTVLTGVQTVKGWAFVFGSATLLYWLVSASQRELERTNERLDAAVQQSSILHRILRHNLRNTCTVIDGNSQLLVEHVEDNVESIDPGNCIEAIREQTDRLHRISEKTRRLRELVVADGDGERIDFETVVREEVATARERYPEATFDVDARAAVDADVDGRLALALEELLENAVEHNGSTDPTVEVALEGDAEAVRVEICDDGPGLPDVERAVLESDVEGPMYHSEGLGLWVARTAVLKTGGELDVRRMEPTGTLVEVSVPA